MSPPIALKPDVAVGADEKKRVGDMRQVIARVGAWKLPVSSGSESARYADLLQEEFCSRLLFGGCLGFGTLAD